MALGSAYQEFIRVRTYARWLEKEERRETWHETVTRYRKFFQRLVPETHMLEFLVACAYVKYLNVMPSMRALWSAGPALEHDNIAGYNCAYTTVEKPKDFAEILYILMNGAGVGFSVERQFIANLPVVPKDLEVSPCVIEFEDSKRGWAEGYESLVSLLYDGSIPQLSYSKVRPKGAPLKTFGGRASGPEPLKQLCAFTIQTFENAKGRKLNSLEVFDLVCMIANCVVVGGVRRSCRRGQSDERMRNAKTGDWWKTHPWRALANISVAYTEKPDSIRFIEEWASLMKSGCGERGIVNREGFRGMQERLSEKCGVNPCGEISLESKQFCNLTEVVVRPGDTLEDLKRKVRNATILGTMQATLTDFQFISPEWKMNCERDRLLGVSLTGTCDHPVLLSADNTTDAWLQALRDVAYAVNLEWSEVLGIEPAAAITCVKPSGTVSQLVNSSSGLHTRYAPYYLRRVRITTSDPLFRYMDAAGMPWEPETGEEKERATTAVFTFPIKSPDASLCRAEQTALEQLEYWKLYKQVWTDHNPSVTIYVKEHEWVEVGAWVYKHWDLIGGLSFLPYEHVALPLMPYEECSQAVWAEAVAAMPKLDFTKAFAEYEQKDNTTGSREFACQGGVCEL